VNDPDENVEIVLKLIPLGSKGSDHRTEMKKIIEKEMKVGIITAEECLYLISYKETFEWGDYFCLKMEYCINGDIQKQIDNGKIFTEDVIIYIVIIILLLLFIELSGNNQIFIPHGSSAVSIRKRRNNSS
jgi:hypothetical protein